MGWAAVIVFLAGVLISSFLPNNRWKILIAAGAMILPPLAITALYYAAAQTGCSGGDCTGAMIIIGLMGVAVAIVAIAAAGALFQSLIGSLLQAVVGRIASAHTARLMAALLPLILALVPIAYLGHLARRPAERVPARCDGRINVARIGDMRFRFPVAAEVTLVRDDAQQGTLLLGRHDDALRLCNETQPTGSAVNALDISRSRLGWLNGRPSEPRKGDWVGWYFGGTLPLGPRSLCDQHFLAGSNEMFCRPDPLENDVAEPGVHLVLKKSDEPWVNYAFSKPVKWAVPTAAETLASLAPDYAAPTQRDGFELYRKEGQILLARRSPNGNVVTEVVVCRVQGATVRCFGWSPLSATTEARFFTRLNGSGSADARAIAAVESVHRFIRAMQVE